jgi:tRNA-binding EMAP/Myf-like protein
MGSVTLAFAALLSYPSISSAVFDCSYGGAFNPPLKDVNPVDGFCEAKGPLKANGSLVIPQDTPMELIGPASIQVTDQPPRFPLAYLPGTFALQTSVLATIDQAGFTGDLIIDARGDIINNNGILSMVAPFDDIRLRARASVSLLGPNLGSPLTNPSSQIIGDTVRLSGEKGNISMNNTVVTSYAGNMDFVAKRGSIFVHNTVLFSLQDGVNTIGECRFHPQFKNGVRIGVVEGIVDNPDPTNILVCIVNVTD